MRVLLALLVVAAASGQEDKTKGLKNKQVVEKAITETLKQKAFKFTENVTPARMSFTVEGSAKCPDFCYMKTEKGELFCSGDKKLVKTDDGKILTLKEVPGNRENMRVNLARNPMDIFSEIKLALIQFADEKLGGPTPAEGCVVISVKCLDEQVKEQIYNGLRAIDLGNRMRNWNPDKFIDYKTSRSVYHLQIAKDSLLIKQIVWDFAPSIGFPPKGRGMNPPDADDVNCKNQIDITQYVEGIDIEIPREIKTRLGIK